MGSGEKWPVNRTLNYNTLLQLMLLLRGEKKWDEVMCAVMVFTLRQHPEWRKERAINLAPSDPFVLALEKDQNKRNGKTLKRCCSACSIGRRCFKINSGGNGGGFRNAGGTRVKDFKTGGDGRSGGKV